MIASACPRSCFLLIRMSEIMPRRSPIRGSQLKTSASTAQISSGGLVYVGLGMCGPLSSTSSLNVNGFGWKGVLA